MNKTALINKKYRHILDKSFNDSHHAYQSVIKKMDEAYCRFGSKVVPVLFKPHFITFHQENLLKISVFHIMKALEKIVASFLETKDFQNLFDYSPDEIKLFQSSPGFKRNIIIARLDGFISASGAIKFIECNSDSPASMGYSDVETSIFLDTFPLKILGKKYSFYQPNRRIRLLNSLLSCYREFGGSGKPRIAIVDWNDVRTYPEFIMLQEFFASHGISSAIVDPRELIYRNGKLKCKEFDIDLVYKRVIIREAIEKKDELKEFFRAYRSGNICFVNSFRSLIAGNKLMLAVLSDEKYQSLFTHTERRIIKSYIPWSRKLAEGFTVYHRKKIDLIPYIVKNRKNFVLKPAEGYGGKNVVVGCKIGDKRWPDIVNKCLKTSWLVQEFVDIPTEDFPVFRKKSIVWEKRNLNLNPFAFNGNYGGSFSRISKSPIINISAGGGLIPTIPFSVRK